MSTGQLLGTLAITLLFALVFLRGNSLHALGKLGHRRVVSLAGGAAVAYVFIDLSPEVQEAANALAKPGYAEFARVAMMMSFLCFYGLEQFVLSTKEEEGGRALFRVHLLAFGAYAWVVSYLLVRSQDRTQVELVLYALAMSLHFLGVAHTLREEHGELYDRRGAVTLAVSCLAGWGCGLALPLPDVDISVLLALVAGGVIANTVIAELPREKEGRFGAFVLGAAGYTALLFLAR